MDKKKKKKKSDRLSLFWVKSEDFWENYFFLSKGPPFSAYVGKDDISCFFFVSTEALAAVYAVYVWKDDISCFFFVFTGPLGAA